MSIRLAARLAAAIGFALVLLLGTFLVLQTMSVFDRAGRVSAVYDPAARQAELLAVGLSDMERGVAAFLITGDLESLRPYTSGTRRVELSIAALRGLTADDDKLEALTLRIERDLESWIEKSANPIIEARRDDRLQEAAEIYRSPANRALLASIEADVTSLRAGLNDRRDEVFSALVNQTNRLLVSVVVAMVLFGVALALAARFMERGFLGPLDHLRHQIRAVTRGDMHRVISGSGPPELRTLGTDVEELRRNLVAQIDEANSARQAMQQEAPVVTLIQGELGSGRIVSAPGLEIYGELKPAEGVLAGDWWDTGRLSDSGEVALILADISGHGAKSGLAAMRLKEAIRVMMRGRDLESVISGTAAQFQGEDWYATLVAIAIDPTTGEVRYVNAGHPAPLVIGPDGELVETLDRTALPLGIASSAEIATTVLPVNHTILMFSDGLLESRDAQGEELGVETLGEWLRLVPAEERGPRRLVPWLIEAARERAGSWHRDDLTVVAVRRV